MDQDRCRRDISLLSSCDAKRWQCGEWKPLKESISIEEPIWIRYEGQWSRIWAWPYPDEGLEDLCLGYVLLEKAAGKKKGIVSPVLSPEKGSRAYEVHLVDGVSYEEKERRKLSPEAILKAMRAFLREPCACPDLWESTGCFHRAGLVEMNPAPPSGGAAAPNPAPPGGLRGVTPLRHPQCRKMVAPHPFCGSPECREIFAEPESECGGESGGEFGGGSEVFAIAEDIGRHNCLDRLAGFLSRAGRNPEEFALFLSARITASLYMKARRAGFSFLVSRAAVSSTPLESAEADGVTLIGFCRPEEHRLTLFTNPRGYCQCPF